MKLQPSVPSLANMPTAQQPVIGLEKRVYLSTKQTVKVGEVEFTAAGTASWRSGPSFDLGVGVGDGRDLFAVVLNKVVSASRLELALDVEESGAVTDIATAIMGPPATAPDQSFDLPFGYAADLNPSNGASNLVNKILATINAATAGGDAGLRIGIYYGPKASEWTEVECIDTVTPTFATKPGVPIPCGDDPARWTKKGRGEAGSLEMVGPYFGWADHLGRYVGHDNCSVRVDIYKQGEVLTERQLMWGYNVSGNPVHNEGDEKSTFTTSGTIAGFAMFQAVSP